MTGLLLITTLLAANAPPINVAEALDEFDVGNYARAGLLLDEFARDEPDQYRANNLHYLRGRIAEGQQDWKRAEREFNLVGADSVLYELALWRLARVALLDHRTDDARLAIGWLPRGFPSDLMMDLADLAPEALALEIYDSLATREARLESALIREDRGVLWILLRENQNDDVAVRAAREIFDASLPPGDRLFLAKAYAGHRTFDFAETLYASLVEDPDHGAEALYGLGRIYFQLARYDDALGLYRATMLLFPNSAWARQAETQLATTYWRKLDFETSATAYLELIGRAGSDRAKYFEAVRDLIDVYRGLGDTASALDWIGRALANRPPASDRAVLVFTRAKIEYLEGDWEAALASFHQVAEMSLRAVPNGTDLEEIRFFEAQVLERLGRADEARAIWRRLAGTPFTYYGLKASEKLGDSEAPGFELSGIVERTFGSAPGELCRRPSIDSVGTFVRSRRLAGTREWLLADGESSRVGELVFLRLWDEAFYWTHREASRHEADTLADLAFLAGHYRQSMLYADRIRPRNLDGLFERENRRDAEADALLEMLFPAGFADLVCREAAGAASNPLWLRSIMWQESRYDPGARSGAIARGLMQFIPETAVDVGNQVGMANLDVTRSLYAPEVSIRLGAHYWASLMAEFGEPEMALAAYNGGPHNVRRWRAKSPGGEIELFVSDIGFIETKDYVRRVFELYARYAYLQR